MANRCATVRQHIMNALMFRGVFRSLLPASLAGFLFFLLAAPVFANNLSISNSVFHVRNTSAKTMAVDFNISWENSWRTSSAPNNYDAVWVFLKVKKDGVWYHGMLKTAGSDPAGTSPGSNSDLRVQVSSDRMGAFLYRKTDGTGTMSSSGVRLTFDYSEAPLSAGDSDELEIKIFGIEMVYIPEGAFEAGDTSSTATFKQGSSDSDPWSITSEAAISVTNTTSNGYYYTSAGTTGESSTGSAFTIPANFPKGYGAFYLMKYSITQGQYKDFLNMLTRAQQNTRTETSLGSGTTSVTNRYVMSDTLSRDSRQAIRCDATIHTSEPIVFYMDYNGNGTGDEDDDGKWIAMNHLSWMDLLAYADWAGLRPFTELEFEKAARGPNSAVSGEYAWGTATVASSTYGVTNEGASNEAIATNYSTTVGNAIYTSTVFGSPHTGPVRVGIFAAHSGNSGRVTAGAGYYGNMELTGNLWNRAVTVGNSTGRAFIGSHGDGVLTSTSSYEGNATNTDWPGISGTPERGVVTSSGSGFRGATYNASTPGRISFRGSAAGANDSRIGNYGGRLARTAD